MNHRNFLFAIALTLGLVACQTDATEPAASDYDFYPLETGRFWNYDVSEQQFSLNGPPVSRTYQIREVLSTRYDEQSGKPAYRLERFRRQTDNQSWQADSVGSVRLLGGQLIRTDNGLDYVKLIFPVSDRLEWNGNAFNALGSDEYQFRNARQPYSVLTNTYPETVTVVQQNDSTLVDQDKRLEVYARGVGMVYRERVKLQFCSSTPACVGKGQIDFGIRQYVRLKASGKL